MRPTRVLIIESVLENAEFVREALAEAQEKLPASLAYESLHLECASDAVDVLENEPFDAVLYGVDRTDRSAVETFTSLRTHAPGVPVVLILEARDAGFGRMLLRHGLQDFLIRGEFDYMPLARAVENAIERQRVLTAALSVQLLDPLTGLLSARAFSVMAERELSWMADTRVPGLLVAAELPPQSDDLATLEAANRLLLTCGSGPLACRWTSNRLLVLGRAGQFGESAIPGVRIGTAPVAPGCALEELIDTAAKSLCENGLAYPAPVP